MSLWRDMRLGRQAGKLGSLSCLEMIFISRFQYSHCVYNEDLTTTVYTTQTAIQTVTSALPSDVVPYLGQCGGESKLLRTS